MFAISLRTTQNLVAKIFAISQNNAELSFSPIKKGQRPISSESVFPGRSSGHSSSSLATWGLEVCLGFET